MERLLLLWDEMDDCFSAGRHLVGGALSEVAGATQRAAAHLAGSSAAVRVHRALTWLRARPTDQP